MFFYLSKIFSILFFPFPLVFLIIFIYLIYKKNKLLLTIWILFGIFSSHYFSSFLLQKLEDQFPNKNLKNLEKVDAIIVLGGLSNPLRMVSDWPEFTDGVDRILIALEIYSQKKADYIILSGATGFLFQVGKPESITLYTYLKNKVEEDKILIDSISKNTAENAIESLKICKNYNFKKVYLITSAFHMYRAFYTFQTIKKKYYSDLEIMIEPIPVDYRSYRVIAGPEDFFPSDKGIYKSTIAIKEIIGIFGYKLKGYL